MAVTYEQGRGAADVGEGERGLSNLASRLLGFELPRVRPKQARDGAVPLSIVAGGGVQRRSEVGSGLPLVPENLLLRVAQSERGGERERE